MTQTAVTNSLDVMSFTEDLRNVFEWVKKRVEDVLKEVFSETQRKQYRELKQKESLTQDEQLQFYRLEFLMISWNKKLSESLIQVYKKHIINWQELLDEDFEIINKFYAKVEWKPAYQQETMVYSHMFWESICSWEDCLKAIIYARKEWNEVLSQIDLA